MSISVGLIINNLKQNKMRKYTTSSMKRNTSYKGEPLEAKVRRITQNKEPISDGAPLIFTERKDGVRPEYDIRTDRFELAIDAMDRVSKTHKAKRDERHNPKDSDKDSNKGGDNNSGSTSVQTVDSITPK